MKSPRYKISLFKNGKLIRHYASYVDKERIDGIYDDLLENNNIIFPQKFINYNAIIPLTSYLVIIKTKEEGDTDIVIRNEYGRLVEITSKSDDWVIVECEPFDIEETFWLYGHNPTNDRFDFTRIIKEIITKDINEPGMVKSIRVVHNKIVIQSDYDDFNMVITKCEQDATRLYYKLMEALNMLPKHQVLFMGIATSTESVSIMYDLILDNTDWDIKKIRRLNTRH